MTDEPPIPANDVEKPLVPSELVGTPDKALFHLGQVVATPGALRVLEEIGVAPLSLICRHQCGDWGDLEDQDRWTNNSALINSGRLFSAYDLTRQGTAGPCTERIWIITEADRSSTCVLLPSEY